MTITLTSELERAVAEAAQKRSSTAEAVVLETLREKFLPMPEAAGAGDALSEWEQRMQSAAAQIAAGSDGEHAGLAAIEKERR